MHPGTWRAGSLGAVFGIVCVISLVVAGLLGVFGSQGSPSAADDFPVLVVLVLPDADGVAVVRLIDRYDREGGRLTVSSVDPLTSATVPGTSATTLAEAYSFGGGDGLAAAYADATSAEKPGWIAVGPDVWLRVMGSVPVRMQLRTGIEVFDGTGLYSYPAGVVAVAPSEMPRLMDGAAFLDSADRKALREQCGDALARAVSHEEIAAMAGIATNLSPPQLDAVLTALKSAPERADTTP